MDAINLIIRDIRKDSFHIIDWVLSNDVLSTISEKGIKIRKLFAPLLRQLYKTQSEYKFVSDNRKPLKKSGIGKIFIGNHRQRDDIVFSACAIKKSAYFVFGNRYLLLDSFSNGLGLWAHGVISLNRDNKQNRSACYEKMKFILEHGGNIIIFPEGYWNLADDGQRDERHEADAHNSENWLIQDFNIGFVRLAQETGADIVPFILHYDECGKKRCYGRRGQEFRILPTDNVFEKKDYILTYMRSNYFELMEKYSFYCRKDLESNGITLKEQWEQLKKDLIAACDIASISYNLDLADEKKIGKAKVVNPVTTPEEAFSFMKRLVPKKENAFLLKG